MSQTRTPSLRERLERGVECTVVARYWPGGLSLRIESDPSRGTLGGSGPTVALNLDGEVWHARATDVDPAPNAETTDVYLTGDDRVVNIAFGTTAARAGAFNSVRARAFKFD